MNDDGLWVETVRANGLEFEVLMAGGGDRLALLLHGFPEHAISWREQMEPLARLGYKVWAPNQRGYGRSSRPGRVEDYDIERLMEDVAGLIDAADAKETVLIGHDWGGVVAWCFASRKINPLKALVILNVPHPACYVRSMGRPGQLMRSWYAWAFQVPWLPEWLGSRASRAGGAGGGAPVDGTSGADATGGAGDICRAGERSGEAPRDDRLVPGGVPRRVGAADAAGISGD